MKGKFLFLIGLVLILSSVLSYAAMMQGDSVLPKDSKAALSWYKLSKNLNPLNSFADKRILAESLTQLDNYTNTEEYAGEIRESNLAKAENFQVLGTSVILPVLMYHYIRVNPYPTDIVGFGLSVTPYDFDLQMKYLKDNGYHTISLDELGQVLFNKGKLPNKAIVLTFDDGYRDLYTDAYPILKKYGLTGVSFVITGVVDTPRYLTWDMISEMNRSSVFTFASHTVDHVALTYSSDSGLQYELSASKKDLEKHLGYPINWLAYPYGNVDDHVAQVTAHVGYVGAFGTNNGTFQTTDKLYTLPRIRIGGGMSVGMLASSLPY